VRWLPAAAAVAAIGLVGAVAGCGSGEQTGDRAAGPAPGDTWSGSGFFGTNAPLLRAYAGPSGSPGLDVLARSIGAAGISWARVVFDQAVEQRRQGETDWTVPDQIVGALSRNGVRTEAVFVGTAGWAANFTAAIGCGAMAYPADVPAWSDFVGAAVSRYGPDGTFWREHPELRALPIQTWEIGNEENLRMFWCPAADPKQYAGVYSASRAAAHAVDGDAHVIVGGLAPTFEGTAGPGDLSAADFLRRMIAADPALVHEIPAVAVHLYAPSVPLVFQELRLYRAAMTSAGLGRTPIVVNEFGWHTSGPHDSRYASEAERPALIARVTAGARETNCGVVALGVHTWVSAQADPNNPDDWYGLADPATGVPNQSGRAYTAAIAAADKRPATPTAGLAHLCG